jgi:hypothetical protein
MITATAADAVKAAGIASIAYVDSCMVIVAKRHDSVTL